MTAAGDGPGLSPQRDEPLQFQAVEARDPGRLSHASAGETREVRNIHGRVYMNVIWRPGGRVDVVQGETDREFLKCGLLEHGFPASPWSAGRPHTQPRSPHLLDGS